MVAAMRWDMHTATALGGVVMLAIGGAILFEDARAVFVPVIGMIAGFAAITLASRARLKERIDVLEKRIGQAEWRRGA
jgi:hypothetical protein